MIKSKKNLIKIIASKTAVHLCAFDVLPDIMVISQDQYDLVKDSSYINTLRVIIEENIHSPILLKK